MEKIYITKDGEKYYDISENHADKQNHKINESDIDIEDIDLPRNVNIKVLYLENNYNREIKNIRNKRDELLKDSDKFMLPDYPPEKIDVEEARKYRKYLRDLPATIIVDNIDKITPTTFEEYLGGR